MRILVWHVHGSWTTAFVQGRHEYVLPVAAGRGPDGRGRAVTWDWPASAREVPLERLAELPYDAVVLQRPHELELVSRLTGLEPGATVPAVYVEHNTPAGEVPFTRHLLADRKDIPVVHVTPFNALLWDSGDAPVRVIEHGILDPGHRATGELARAAVVVNQPLRRGRAVGLDVIAALAERVPTDVFGMGVTDLPGLLGHGARAYDDLPQARLHEELARRRVYVHTTRWTSLGLSLIEAMQLGLPVVALATTDAARAVGDGGVVTTDVGELLDATENLLDTPDEARRLGHRARAQGLRRYGLDRFRSDWDRLLQEVST